MLIYELECPEKGALTGNIIKNKISTRDLTFIGTEKENLSLNKWLIITTINKVSR